MLSENVKGRVALWRKEHNLPAGMKIRDVLESHDDDARLATDYQMAGLFEEYAFFYLKDLLAQDNQEAYITHNGDVLTGLEFMDMIAIIGRHALPSEIFKDHYAGVKDISRAAKCDGRFVEKIFGLKEFTFKSDLIQPGYGLRLDKNGSLRPFLEYILSNDVPLFAYAINLEKDPHTDRKACVINALEV